jgi:hypothetical protein
MPSFSVRCLYRWLNTPGGDPYTYEERITLWSARDIEASIALAETEAQSYATESECEYIGFCQAYAMTAEVSASGVEVFSLLRDSVLTTTEYINAFFATGTEREGDA